MERIVQIRGVSQSESFKPVADGELLKSIQIDLTNRKVGQSWLLIGPQCNPTKFLRLLQDLNENINLRD
jgi:hypothetical protein